MMAKETKKILSRSNPVAKLNSSLSRQNTQQVNTDITTPMLAGIFVFLLLFVGGLGWLYVANLSGAVIANGMVAVSGKPKTVQHLDGGIIAGINVQDGSIVKQGDVLIKLDPTLLTANLQIYQSRLREATARKARLVAERDGVLEIVWDDSLLNLLNVHHDPDVKQGHQNLFDARRTSTRGQIERLHQQIAQYRNQANGVQALKESKIRQKQMLAGELANINDLKEKGLVTNAQVINLEREREELTGQLGEREAELARIQNSISEAEIQILQIERELRQSVLAELREVEQEINDITQQLQSTSEQLKRVEIRAPVDGVIHELSVFTIGGVIGPGASILQIIPQDEQFVIEANVEPQFVDELYPGQVTTVRFSAFNQQTTPELSGAVSSISANVVFNEQNGVSYYKVSLNVPPSEMSRLNGLQLVPGMPVEAFIKTRDRTALNYLVKPLLDQFNRALREE